MGHYHMHNTCPFGVYSILFQHSVYCHQEQHAEKNIWTARRGQKDGRTTNQDEKVGHVDVGDKNKCIQNFSLKNLRDTLDVGRENEIKMF